MKHTKSIIAAGAVALAALVTPRALAAVVLEFDDVSIFGGTLSYGGATGIDPLIGTDILFDTVTGVGTSPAGSLEIVDGKLNFSTGPNISEETSIYTFADGGSFVLTGTVIRPDTTVVASGVLVTGSFTGTSIVLGLGGGNGLFTGVGIDTKNPFLLAYYGITATSFEFANTDIGFAAGGLEPDGGFIAEIRDADLTNTAAVPEPTTALLAVLGLGLGFIRRANRAIH
jgi:PEP-CTERM motif